MEPVEASPGLETAPTRGPASRDRYIDFLRTASLLVVVLWHWVFTVVVWRADGPHAGNPIGTIHGFWGLTWLLQVMPVFFFVGGFSHLMTWQSVRRSGGGYGSFVSRRLKRLLAPTLVVLAFAAGISLAASALLPQIGWINRGLLLMVSPLWFLGLYVILVLATPPLIVLHEKGGEIVPVVLAGVAALLDILRFRYEVRGVELINLFVIWGLAHQLGFFWPRLVAAPRRFAWCLALGGFFALLALTNMGLYPRSMVGVPGEPISNMAPPTLCIVALTIFQVGMVLLLRDRISDWLDADRAQRMLDWAGARAMTVYLWHSPGFAIAYALLTVAGMSIPQSTNLAWWLQRPVWLLAPALCTAPLVILFSRFERRRGRGARPAKPQGAIAEAGA